MASLPVIDKLHQWLGLSPRAANVLTAGVLLLVTGVFVGLWLAFGRTPRRRRRYRRVQHLLQAGAWKEALAVVHDLQSRGKPAGAWGERLRTAEAACHRAGCNALLTQKEYEKALEHSLTAAQLLRESADTARGAVVDTMLAEARQLFAATAGPDTAATQGLVARILFVHCPCPEATFWQALCQLREGKADLAEAALRGVVEAGQAGSGPAPRSALDPLLYLGALLLRRGEAKEALRYLTEANRLDGNCPFVVAQLGAALVEAGGDPQLAVRALQRALGPRGFQLWKHSPQRAWVEGLPEASYVRRLASQHRYVCPLWGPGLQPLLRQTGLALGSALYRLGSYQEAADVFNRILEEGAPSLPVLRGLGLSLARLERYDQAFKHLRAAHELAPEDRSIAGHLALCGAKGKPLRPEDRANNIAWAVWLLGRYTAPADAEWIGLASAVFAEARANGVAVNVQDQVQLCEQLLDLRATDVLAAEAFHHLQATDPAVVRPEYAWLYCRAAQQHGARGEHALELFARTFADQAAARVFFKAQGWDLEEVEYAYLALAADRQPGQFPPALGADYVQRGEELLLTRSSRLEEAGQPDAALAALEMLVRLAPGNARAQDRLARLAYHQGNGERALEVLQAWAGLEPTNYLPWLRQAVLHQQRGELAGCVAAVKEALRRTQGKRRAETALLGARLMLAGRLADTPAPAEKYQVPDAWQQALAFLHECLQEEPGHVEALWLTAALRSLTGDQAALASGSAAMKRPEVTEARFQFLAAVCHLAAGDHAGVLDACQRAAGDPALANESAYLLGWAYIARREPATAALAFQRVLDVADSPSSAHARAILGGIRFHQGAYDEAGHLWQGLEETRRKSWGFDEPLAGATFLAALKDLHEGRFEQAASRLRDAGKLGHRDRRLGPLLALALFKAGQHLFYQANGTEPERLEMATGLLGQALKAGLKDPQVAYLLALCHKRLKQPAEARVALRQIASPDANVLLQLGLLAFGEGQLPEAAEDFERAAELDSSSYEAAHNLLLTRLASGQLPACAALVPKALPLAPTAEDKRFLALLGALVQRTLPQEEGAVVAAGPAAPAANGAVQQAILAGMPRVQEQRLLEVLCGLGRTEAGFALLRMLAKARPNSPAVQEAHLQMVLLHARLLADRCQWTAGAQQLQPLARLIGEGAAPGQTVAVTLQIALFNLLGVCACMGQDFSDGARCFASALALSGNDVWLHQNLALAHELQGRLEQADIQWHWYFDLLDNKLPAPQVLDYHENLAFEGLTRLVELYTKREKWSAALPFAQRAQRLRPRDAETLERLFHLYQQARRPADARRTLRKLRELCPHDPQYELYELDVRDVRGLDDMDHMLADIRRILGQHPGDMRVEERAMAMAGNVIPHMDRLCQQHADRLGRILDQVRRLPSYQVNWPGVHDEMRRLGREFHKLRKLTQKCLPLVTQPEQQRVVKELAALIDNKIEVCESLRG
jgi:tetratricopeptide (TPR) repeat protein